MKDLLSFIKQQDQLSDFDNIRIGLASPEKINTASPFLIGELSLINTVVVEPDTDSRWVEAVVGQGVSVVKA